jgi:hypothetical protein
MNCWMPMGTKSPPHSLGPTFLSGSKHRRSHGWKLGGPRVNGNKLGSCSWNDIIGLHLGAFWGHFVFWHTPFDTHYIPTNYHGKNEKKWKKSWIFTLCNAIGYKHYLNCTHFSFTSLTPYFGNACDWGHYLTLTLRIIHLVGLPPHITYFIPSCHKRGCNIAKCIVHESKKSNHFQHCWLNCP